MPDRSALLTAWLLPSATPLRVLFAPFPISSSNHSNQDELEQLVIQGTDLFADDTEVPDYCKTAAPTARGERPTSRPGTVLIDVAKREAESVGKQGEKEQTEGGVRQGKQAKKEEEEK